MHDSAHPFDRSGPVIYANNHLAIHAGNVFKAQTVKGHWNHIMVMRVIDGWMCYLYVDKPLKVPLSNFIRGVMSGEIINVPVGEMDVDRLTSFQIVMDGLANHRSAEAQLEYVEEQAMMRGCSV